MRVKSVMDTSAGTETTYFAGAHYEVVDNGTAQTILKYYYAGSQRIAMRTNGTLNFLLGDHLGSTSLTTFANGTVISEMRYKAWGDVRYSSAYTPTDYTYTGQFSYTADFGLMFYNARWYDSSLGRFAQADTIMLGGIQGLDRYAYVSNNPLLYKDPSGHIPCQYYAGNGCTTTPMPTAEQELQSYGVTLVNTWTTQQQLYVLSGVRKVANALGKELKQDPKEAFKATYGITPNDPLKFVMGSCDPRNGVGGCANKDGQKAGAYTWSSHEVEFYSGAPFYVAGGNRSWLEANGMNVHTIVHELGHAFASRFASGPSNPYTMIGVARFDDIENTAYTTNRGFRASPDPISAADYWRPNSSTETGETFANMFLGWAYGAWDNDTYGTQRGNYMTTNMADTWLPILTGK